MSQLNDMPMLRLELQSAKHSLITLLNDRHDDLQKMLAASFDHAIEHLQAQMDLQVQRALTEVFARAIDDAARAAAEGLADELANAMAEQVRATVKARMSRTAA